MADKFGPNPQDNFRVIDPSSFLPSGWTAAYADPEDAQKALDNVQAATDELAAQGKWNEALNVALGVVKTLATGVIL